MNYFELINKCLLELNYKQVSSFQELIKNDHKRIKEILNTINSEICNAENWNFLLRKQELMLNAGETEIENPINGRILHLIVDGEIYKYNENIQDFILGKPIQNKYSCMNNKLLFPKFKTDKEITAIYYTKNCAKGENGNEKLLMEAAEDESLLPMPFAKQILVYGTCLRIKANPQHFKFPYWLGMYNEALCNLKSKTSISASNAPAVNIFRK